jgi:DNA-directed RNA polymerase specialized sigma24 family protein
MSDSADQSVTQWLESLKDGDPVAAQRLWQRYFEELIRLARARLRGAPRRVADEEDAALSAFDSFCRGAARGRYPKLDDRQDLWRLLVVITERKAIDQVLSERRWKRGRGKILGTPDLGDGDRQEGGAAGLACPSPSPEIAAMVSDECRRLLALLGDDTLRQVAELRMEGYTNEEVAGQLRCSLRSVARKVERIRRTWLDEG